MACALCREEILREREEAVLASCTFQPKCGSRCVTEPKVAEQPSLGAG